MRYCIYIYILSYTFQKSIAKHFTSTFQKSIAKHFTSTFQKVGFAPLFLKVEVV
jgi:hypothetical protein